MSGISKESNGGVMKMKTSEPTDILNEVDHASTSSCDLSFTLGPDLEVDAILNTDGLPAFEIRDFASLSRSPSPISSDEAYKTPAKNDERDAITPPPFQTNSEYVALQDINAQISPPSDSDATLSHHSSLETIYEGVFLNTPPRQSPHGRQNTGRGRTNFIEKGALNRLQMDKENRIKTSAAEKTNASLQMSNGGNMFLKLLKEAETQEEMDSS